MSSIHPGILIGVGVVVSAVSFLHPVAREKLLLFGFVGVVMILYGVVKLLLTKKKEVPKAQAQSQIHQHSQHHAHHQHMRQQQYAQHHQQMHHQAHHGDAHHHQGHPGHHVQQHPNQHHPHQMHHQNVRR